MSLFHGAKTVLSGLILSYDAANVKSYPGSGTTWYDLSGNGNHGTINLGEKSNTWLQNSSNTSDFFYISTSNSTTINNTFSTTTGGWTIEESVYTYSTNYPEADGGSVVSDSAYGGGATGFDWQHGIGVGSFKMGMSSSSGGSYEDEIIFTVPSPYNTFNTWRLRTMVWNRSANTFSFYINGNLIGTGNTNNTSGTSVYDGGGCLFGTLYGWKFFGRRSTIKVYNFPFTQTEVSSNWISWKGRYGL